MNRKVLFPTLAFLPAIYPLAELASHSLDMQTATQFMALALFVGASGLIGRVLASRVEFFRGSQFWASEAGLLVVLFGFLGPLFSLMPGNPLFDALSEHLLMPALLSVSCLAGVGAIVDDGLRRPQTSRVRR